MPRGITQDQVNAAADAILGAGENPTVEKVRAELGTGSPNTVTRMLDAWRSQLGERLRQLSALPDVPPSVGQAMMTLWQLATEHASQAIAGRFAEERAALEAARSALATERQEWAARLEAAEADRARAQAAKDLAEHACATLDAQLQDSHALRADLAQQRDRLQAQCDQLGAELQGLRSQLAEQQQTATAERTRQEAYVRNLEDRAHQEVDRLRQESKQWQQRLEAAERAHREAERLLQVDQSTLRDQMRSAEQAAARHAGQVAALEKALSETRAKSLPKRPQKKSAQRSGKGRSKKGVDPRSQTS
jgi:chromosome segregation ATPase